METNEPVNAPRVVAVNPINPADRKMLDTNFVYHSPKGDQPERYQVLREAGKGMAEAILRLSPPSRERSLALTNLEQAMFWANAAIARNE